MSERITGKVYILSLSGEAERFVDVSVGDRTIIDGEFGSLEIDATVNPARVHGKGNIVIRDKSKFARSKRLARGDRLDISLLDGFPAGSIVYETKEGD